MEARPIFPRLFPDDGLPAAMRPDNGPPFATPAFCGLSQLSVWGITLGSRPQRIEPGRPEQHGAHERLHRTRKAEATRPPAHHQAAQPARFDRCRRAYNDKRPHAALNDRTPAAPRAALPARAARSAAHTTYPGHDVGRRGSPCGTLRFPGTQLFISHTLRQEDLALEETAEGIGSIYFDDVLLARLAARDLKLYV